MSPERIYTCEKEGCEVATSGECIEGVADVDQCPHILTNVTAIDADRPAVSTKSSDPKNATSDKVTLPGTDEFTLATASEITLANVTRFVVIAGEADSGKTTLLASLSDRFQRGQFSGYRFAGSKTLLGFEQRCHLARLRSGGVTPDTDRTKPLEEHRVLHLTVRSIDRDSFVQDLLFTDISGETFRLAKDYVEDAQKLDFLHRADRFVLLVDGELLASPTRREEAYQGSVLILRRCIETGVLDKQSFVDVVFTKIDLIEAADEAYGTSDFLLRIEDRFKQRYEPSLGRLRFFSVDARHLSNRSPRNELASLFSLWVVETPIYGLRYYSSTRIATKPKREFDRYLSTADLVI